MKELQISFLGRVFINLHLSKMSFRSFFRKEFYGIGESLATLLCSKGGVSLDVPFFRLGITPFQLLFCFRRMEKFARVYGNNYGRGLKGLKFYKLSEHVRTGSLLRVPLSFRITVEGSTHAYECFHGKKNV